jgi:hypothetical protein
MKYTNVLAFTCLKMVDYHRRSLLVILPTLEWTSDMKKNCLGCKKDKPVSDFGKTGMEKVLCKSCRPARVVTSGKKSGGKGIVDAIGDIFDGIGDLFS